MQYTKYQLRLKEVAKKAVAQKAITNKAYNQIKAAIPTLTPLQAIDLAGEVRDKLIKSMELEILKGRLLRSAQARMRTRYLAVA